MQRSWCDGDLHHSVMSHTHCNNPAIIIDIVQPVLGGLYHWYNPAYFTINAIFKNKIYTLFFNPLLVS